MEASRRELEIYHVSLEDKRPGSREATQARSCSCSRKKGPQDERCGSCEGGLVKGMQIQALCASEMLMLRTLCKS